MKRLTSYILVSFAAVTAFAEEIDAEIIRHLDFFEKMPVVEELDLIELEEQSRPQKTAGADSDSLDDAIGDPTPDTSKGEGQ